MKRLFISLFILSPFFTAHGFEISDEGDFWKKRPLVENTSPNLSHSSDLVSTDGDSSPTSEVSCYESSNANESNTDCGDEASSSVATQAPNQDELPYDSGTHDDDAYLLAKSRAARKHTGYIQHEKNSYAEKKALTRRQKRMAYREKAAKAAYAKLKTDQQVARNKNEVNEYVSFNNQKTATHVSIPAVCGKWMNAEYRPEEPAHPYFFQLLHELEHGTISPGKLLLEANGYGPDVLSTDNDVEDWRTIIKEWDNDHRHAYGEEYFVRSALKCLEENPQDGNSILMGLWVMLDNISQPEKSESDTKCSSVQDAQEDADALDTCYSNIPPTQDCDDDATYQLSKSRGARKHVGYEKHERGKHREKKEANPIELHRKKINKADYTHLKADQLRDLKEHVLKPSEYDSFKEEMAPDDDDQEAQPTQAADPVDELAQRLNTVSLDSESDSDDSNSSSEHSEEWSVCSDSSASSSDSQSSHDAYYSNIPPTQDDDNNISYQLSKSRGARNRLANKQHKRNENAEKKSLIRKQRNAKKLNRDGNDNDDDEGSSDVSLSDSDSTDSAAQAAERMRTQAHIDEVTEEWCQGLNLLLTRHNNN